MKKRKKTVIVVFIVIIVILTICVTLVAYFFFGKKKYTYFITEDLGKIQAVELQIDGEKNAKVVIYNDEVIEEVMKAMEPVKLKPDFSSDSTGIYRGFNIRLIGENNKTFCYFASRDDGYYEVYVGTEKNGISTGGLVENIAKSSIELDAGEKLYELVNKCIEENLHNITTKDIIEFSENKVDEWRKYEQFEYYEVKDIEVINKNGMTSCTPVRFQIEDKKGYVIVWFFNGVVEDEKGAVSYSDVLQAIVYNEDDEEMNLYDEGISKFLEDME